MISNRISNDKLNLQQYLSLNPSCILNACLLLADTIGAKNIPESKAIALAKLDPRILCLDVIFLNCCLCEKTPVQVEVVIFQPIVGGENRRVNILGCCKLLSKVVYTEFTIVVKEFLYFFF